MSPTSPEAHDWIREHWIFESNQSFYGNEEQGETAARWYN